VDNEVSLASCNVKILLMINPLLGCSYACLHEVPKALWSHK